MMWSFIKCFVLLLLLLCSPFFISHLNSVLIVYNVYNVLINNWVVLLWSLSITDSYLFGKYKAFSLLFVIICFSFSYKNDFKFLVVNGHCLFSISSSKELLIFNFVFFLKLLYVTKCWFKLVVNGGFHCLLKLLLHSLLFKFMFFFLIISNYNFFW